MSEPKFNPRASGGPVHNPWAKQKDVPHFNRDTLEWAFEPLNEFGPVPDGRYLGTVLLRQRNLNGRLVRRLFEPRTGSGTLRFQKGAFTSGRWPRAVYFRRWEE